MIFSGYGFSQYKGGNGSGYFFKSVINSSCSVANFNPSAGGNGDGNGLIVLINSSCSAISSNPFIGGNGNGFSQNCYITGACSVVGENPYLGGTGSGYSKSELITGSCSAIGINPYLGGIADGCSNSEFITGSCSVVGMNPFLGGDADGFSHFEFITGSCAAIGINPYLGGIADGSAFSNNINSSCSVITANPFLGGAGNGFYANNASSFTWKGTDPTTPTDWNTATNWSTNTVPNMSTSVSIPNVFSGNFPVISTSANTMCLNIAGSSSLTIKPGGSLTVNAGLTCNGTLNIKSPTDNSAAGSLIVQGAILGSGTANIDRYYTVSGRWQTTTVPFSNVNSDKFTKNDLPYFNANFYKYNESFNVTPDPVGAVYSNWNLLSGAWQYAHNGSAGAPMPLVQGKGYDYYDQQNLTINFSNSVTDIANSDLTIPVTFTQNDGNSDYFDGWNLIGNPYPSAIDWDSFAKTNIQNTVYYWDGIHNQYVYYNGFGGTQTDDGSNVVNGGSRYVPSLQGFFVKATGNGNFTIPRTSRVHNNQTIWKKSIIPETDSEISYFKLSSNLGTASDELCIRFFPEATSRFDDDYDAFKFFNTGSQNIYSINNDLPLTINSLPVLDTAMIIPVDFNSNQIGNYEIRLNINKLPDDITIFLEDLSNQQVTLLTKNSYIFNYQTAQSTRNFNLFFKHLTSDIPETENARIYSFNKTVYIDCPQINGIGEVDIYNVIGQLILHDNINGTVWEKSIRSASGIYTVKTQINNKISIKKVFLSD